MIVYDVTDLKSFDNVTDWITHIAKVSMDIVNML